MTLPAPFVYISAIMRTGSTMLSEALTGLPQAFILHEPHLGKNTFSLSQPDLERLRAYGVDLYEFLRFRLPLAFILRRLRSIGPMQDYMVREVKRVLVPRLAAAGLQQLGVKEIKHEGWQHYVRHFPDMKVIMLGRDPRDVYISAFRKWQEGTTPWPGLFTPRSAAEQLGVQFSRQLKMCECVDCLPVRYEQMCTDPEVVTRIMEFTASPLQRLGEIGQFVRAHPKRKQEYHLHGAAISDESVYRWRQEEDAGLLEDAREFARRMPDYCAFWGYDD